MSARLALCAALAACALAAAAEPPPLEIEVTVDRDQVYVHEQAVLSVVVHHPSDARASWEPPPFDGFWAERLGTRALPPDASGRYRTEFRRALFPTRTGTLAIAASKLVLVGDGGAERDVPVPAARLRVAPLPPGTPPDVLVGQLALVLSAGDERVRLGKALALSLELSGEGNVWDAPVPALEALLGPDLEVFADPPRLSIGESAGRATTRRSFRFALVPARAGRMTIPPIRVPYFDPKAGELRTAETEAFAFDVFEGSGNLAETAPWENKPRLRDAPPLGWLAGAFALALAGSLLYLARWRRAHLARVFGPAPPSPRLAFDAARAAPSRAERTALLARALRAGIHARHHFDALALTAAEIAERIDDREAIELLHALDGARFARDTHGDDALFERVRAWLRL